MAGEAETRGGVQAAGRLSLESREGEFRLETYCQESGGVDEIESLKAGDWRRCPERAGDGGEAQRPGSSWGGEEEPERAEEEAPALGEGERSRSGQEATLKAFQGQSDILPPGQPVSREQ